MERLVNFLNKNHELSTDNLMDEIKNHLFTFNNSFNIDDDITYFIMDTESKAT